MALYNTNSTPSPFGTTGASVTPDIGAQFFLGCGVVDINVSADWSSQGGSLKVTLIEDTNTLVSYSTIDAYTGKWVLDAGGSVEKLRDKNGNFPLVGSPETFYLLDTSGGIKFEYTGLVSSISRSASPGSAKLYVVTLTSPLKLLSDTSIIFDDFPGYGYAKEGIPSGMSLNGFYQLSTTGGTYAPEYFDIAGNTFESNKTLDENFDSNHNVITDVKMNEIIASSESTGQTFSTHNRSTMWNRIYNLINVFGFYESDSHGWSTSSGGENFAARFGASRNNGTGMRLDTIVYALHILLNQLGPSSPGRYFGGNIISGTNTYNVCALRDGTISPAFNYYGFDVYGFYNQVVGFVGADFKYNGGEKSSLLDLISTICEEAGLDYIIELNPSPTSFNFSTTQTYTNSSFGGILSVRVLDRTRNFNCNYPFSAIAYRILGLEIPDYGDRNINNARINPGDPDPISTAFEAGAFGATFINPLDHDYYLKGTDGSRPYGGNFPVSTTADQFAGADLRYFTDFATNTNVSIKDNSDLTAKMVLGGKQTRMVTVPREHIYQYWGEVSQTGVSDCENPKTVKTRSVPVVTNILDPDDITDFIVIDVKDILPNDCAEIRNGIYLASMLEIRSAMTSYDNWEDFVTAIKTMKFENIKTCLGFNPRSEDEMKATLAAGYVASGTASDGTVTSVDTTKESYGESSQKVGGGNIITRKNTAIADITPRIKPDETKSSKSDPQRILDRLYQKIKDIGEKHYGKTWFVWMPQPTTKTTDQFDAIAGNYVKSWDISDSAYVEPSGYDSLGVPRDNKFVQDAKVSAFVSWEHDFEQGSGNYFIDRFNNPTFVKDKDGNTSKYSYRVNGSEINKDTISVTKECPGQSPRINFNPSVDGKYHYLPFHYFNVYNRNSFDYVVGLENTPVNNFQLSSSGVRGGSGVADDLIINTQSSEPKLGSHAYNGYLPESTLTTLNTTKTEPGLIQALSNFWPKVVGLYNTGVATTEAQKVRGIIDYFTKESGVATSVLGEYQTPTKDVGFVIPDHGENCLNFALVTTDFISYPTEEASSSGENLPKDFANAYADTVLDRTPQRATPAGKGGENSSAAGESYSHIAHPASIPPKLIGIPQSSNRYRYGPWFTDNNFIYAGKVDFVIDDSLVPEEFLLPLYGTLSPSGFSLTENISGFTGLNLAGQATANSIDGYRLFAAEEGSITVPGAPLISKIGDALFAFPGLYVTDISISQNATSVNTSYTFSSVNPRSGKAAKHVISRIRNISAKIKQLGNKK
jgi:hypothetical protein